MKEESINLSVKQQYEAPRTKVVKLQSVSMLAQSPGGLGSPNNYPNGGNPFRS